MKPHYYSDKDSLYLDLAEGPGSDSLEVVPGIVLALDASGQLVAIDIQRASTVVDLSKLEAESLQVCGGRDWP